MVESSPRAHRILFAFALCLMAATAAHAQARADDAMNLCTQDKLAITHPSNGASYADICAKAGRFAAAFCVDLCAAFVSSDAGIHRSALNRLEYPMHADFDKFLRADEPGIALRKLEDAASQAGQADAKAIASQASQKISDASVAEKQVAANSQASGSTSLVTKPTTSDLVAVAADSGAFTETSNGSAVTISGTALGIEKLISAKDLYSTPSRADMLRHLTFSTSLSISQGSTQASAVAAPANSATPGTISNVLIPVTNDLSFNSVTVGYKLYRPFDPLSSSFIKSWKDQIDKNKTKLEQQAKDAMAEFDKVRADRSKIEDTMKPQRQQFDDDFKNAQRGQTTDTQADDGSVFFDFAQGFEKYAEAFSAAALKDPDYLSGAQQAEAKITNLEETVSTIVDTARGCPLFSALYSYSTPSSKPATNDVTLSLDVPFTAKQEKAAAAPEKDQATATPSCTQASPKADAKPKASSTPTGWDLTANFYASWYATLPAGAKYKQFRAYQFSAELDRSIGPTASPRAIWSLAGYGQNQFDKTVLNITSGNLAPGTNITLPSNAQVLLGTSGWIGVAQTKFVFNLAKGMSIPIAAKWSNKTDLLQGSDWRGQFGISYDLSALQKLISPK